MKIDSTALKVGRIVSASVFLLAFVGILLSLAVNIYLSTSTESNLDVYGFQSIDDYLEHYKIPKNQVHERSFQLLSDGFAVDKNAVYYVNDIIPNVDEASRNKLYSRFIGEYLETLSLDPALVDKDTFTVVVLAYGISKDKARVYHYNNVIDQADSETFKGLGRYAVDKNRGYLFLNSKESKIIPGTDYHSFYASRRVDSFAKDANYVYFLERRIPKADPMSFTLYRKEGEMNRSILYSMDRTHVYFEDKIIQGADPKTFAVLENANYSVDKDHLFYQGIRIPAADRETFELVKDSEGVIDAKDAYNIYYQGVAY